MSALSAVSRSMETKEALKRIAEELASDVHVPIEHLEKMNGALGDSRGDPHAPPPSRILTGVSAINYIMPLQLYPYLDKGYYATELSLGYGCGPGNNLSVFGKITTSKRILIIALMLSS